MPTLDGREQALATLQRVVVEASAALIQEVQQRQLKRDSKLLAKGDPIPNRKNTLVEGAAFAPERDIEFAPAFLLTGSVS